MIEALLLGLLATVGNGALTKVGENIGNGLVQKILAILNRKAPNTQTTKLLQAGQEIDMSQAIIDLEPIANDPEVTQLLDEVRKLLASNKELAAKVQAATTNIQIGIKDYEAGELETEIDQETKSQGNTKQVGIDGGKVAGKAVIKINQKIN